MEAFWIAVGIIIALALFVYMVVGAIALLDWASESGFVGVAVYFACWIFLTPFMVVACIVAGIYEHSSS